MNDVTPLLTLFSILSTILYYYYYYFIYFLICKERLKTSTYFTIWDAKMKLIFIQEYCFKTKINIRILDTNWCHSISIVHICSHSESNLCLMSKILWLSALWFFDQNWGILLVPLVFLFMILSLKGSMLSKAGSGYWIHL